MRRPTVTAVILCHTRREFLDTAIASVFKQTSPPDEVIVVRSFPDMPTDAKWVQAGVRFIVLGEDSIHGETIDSGLSAAHSDVVAFLDDDDVWLPSKVNAVRTAFTDPEVNLHRHAYQAVGPGANEWNAKFPRTGTVDYWPLLDRPQTNLRGGPLRWMCQTSPYSNSSTMSVRRAAMEEARATGLINCIQGSTDLVLGIGAAMAGGIQRFEDTPLSVRLLHESNVSLQRDYMGFYHLRTSEVIRFVKTVEILANYVDARLPEDAVIRKMVGMILRHDRALLAGRALTWSTRDTLALLRDAVVRRQAWVARDAVLAWFRSVWSPR